MFFKLDLDVIHNKAMHKNFTEELESEVSLAAALSQFDGDDPAGLAALSA